MRRDADFRHVIHVPAPDLHLQRHAIGAEQDCVQGLVAVRFGNGHIVLELARHRLVEIVHRAHHPITGFNILDDDAKGVHIVDFMERQILVQHLLVDPVQVFFPTQDLRRNFFLAQPPPQVRPDLVDDLLAAPPGLDDLLAQHAVAHGVEDSEAQVFQL